MPTLFVGGAAPSSPYLYDIIEELGLTASLQLVLDAADTRSTDGTSQTWTDITANASNYYRGSGSGADAADPTFNGTAGLADETTYWGLDGGDYFTSTAGHTFPDAWLKNNGACTILIVHYYKTAGANQVLFCASSGTNEFVFFTDSTAKLNLIHQYSNIGLQDTVTAASGAATANNLNFAAMAYDEATTNCDFVMNGTADSQATTASTMTNNRSSATSIWGTNLAGATMLSGSRIACAAVWNVALTTAQLDDIRTRLKARRFTSLP